MKRRIRFVAVALAIVSGIAVSAVGASARPDWSAPGPKGMDLASVGTESTGPMALDGGRIVVIGSSTMAGAYSPMPWNALMAASFEERSLGVVIENRAVPGASIVDWMPGGRYRSVVEDIKADPPTLVVIGTHTNEYHVQMPPQDFETRYDQLVAELPVNSRKLLVGLQKVLGPHTPRWGQTLYTDVVARVADRFDADSVFVHHYIPADAASGLYKADGSHLTEAGHRVLFTAIDATVMGMTR